MAPSLEDIGGNGSLQHLGSLIESLYVSNTAQVQIDDRRSSKFRVEAGVRQGWILSPILFNVYGEYATRNALDEWKGGFSVGGHKINNLRYADDTTLIASSIDELIEMVERVKTASQELGLKINGKKTKVMIIDRQHNNQPNVTHIAGCEVVPKFVYLGAVFSNDGGSSDEIRRPIQPTKIAMSRLTRIWTDRQISNNTKMRLVQSLIFSIFLCGAETWTMLQRDTDRVRSFEMWCWRRLLRVPWTARRTNVSILVS